MQIFFRFYEELNDFLANDKKKKEFVYSILVSQKIKDVIEMIGVPHTEVDLILVNGMSVDFSYLLQDNDHVSVYPQFESFDISNLTKLRPEPLREIKFVLDVHLGKLAKYLRLLGFDTLFDTKFTDEEIANISQQQHRIALTRDKGLLKNELITHGYWVRKIYIQSQVEEIVKRFDLIKKIKPFTRCLLCNGELLRVAKEDIQQNLLPDTVKYYHEFYRCNHCGKIYWYGSHYQKMQTFIKNLQQLICRNN